MYRRLDLNILCYQLLKYTVQAYYTDNSIKLSHLVQQADVYNVDGRLLVSVKNSSEINVSGFGHGIYIVKTQLNGQILNLKVSK